MSVSRVEAITGEQIDLTITFKEEVTDQPFDPYSIEQVDVLQADGQTVIQTILPASITKIDLGTYKITINAVSSPGLVLDRWLFRLEDGGPIKTSIETTNVAAAPSQPAAVESTEALPRHSAVVLRPILLTLEFRDDKTGALFDPSEVRQVEILEDDGVTVIETIQSITRIGTGKYRVQASAVTTPKTILDKWYFTISTDDPEVTRTRDTQVYDQAALGSVAISEVVYPELLFADVAPHDSELVLCGSVKNIGISFRDENKQLVNPAALSLEVTCIDGTTVLEDTYFPATSREPDPPRMLNPYPGKFEFPIGLDNEATDSTKKNKTNRRVDFLFTWRAKSIVPVKASLTIDPGVNPNSTLIWTAVADGTPGNFISVQYVDPGTPNAALSIVRDGAILTVNLATNAASAIITTAASIITEVSNNEEVAEIVTVESPVGETGLGVVGPVSSANLSGGIDGSEELLISENVRIVTQRVMSLISKLRLQIDKALKLIQSDPDYPCFLGYTDGQLYTYLESGLQIINAYQPSGCFSIDTYPYQCYEFTLIEASLLAGVMSQQLFAVDTDVPNWNDQGNAFVIQHQPQLAQYLNFLSQRLDKIIPMLKLNFVSSGSLHIEAGPNFRLAQLINAAPAGALFRNVFFKS
jgi:hypothetical protein